MLPQENAPNIVDNQILSNGCFAIADPLYSEFKRLIALEFGVKEEDIYCVGSGRLGFSIAEKIQEGTDKGERYREFNENSDLDLAIVSPGLFDTIWEAAFDHMNEFGNWRRAEQFEKYFFRGWIRADFLPREMNCEALKHLKDYFRDLSRDREYCDNKVSAGLYRTRNFLKTYQTLAVKQCQEIERLNI